MSLSARGPNLQSAQISREETRRRGKSELRAAVEIKAIECYATRNFEAVISGMGEVWYGLIFVIPFNGILMVHRSTSAFPYILCERKNCKNRLSRTLIGEITRMTI